MIQLFSTSGGYEGLTDFFNATLKEIAPLMPTLSIEESLINPIESDSMAVGDFWSKRLGQPVRIFFGNNSMGEENIRNRKSLHIGNNELLLSISKGKLKSMVFALSEEKYPRDKFREKISD